MSKLLDLLCPCMCVESVPAINTGALRERGIQAILLDLDNTLVPWRGMVILPDVRDWVRRALEQGMKMCIVSNTRAMKRLRKLSAELDIPYVSKGWKPRRIGFRAALDLLGISSSQAAVVGDQVFTDVLGGNRVGAFTILVRPIHRREFFVTRINRFFERMVLRLLGGRGMLCAQVVEGEQTSETGSQKETEH